MNTKGFTLVELLIVVAVTTILLALASINFSDYNVKYNIEKQARQMEADFDNIRLTAIQQKKRYDIRLSAKAYTFAVYSSEFDATGTTVSTTSVPYQIQSDNSSISFDSRGLVTNAASQKVWLLPTGTDAAYDSLFITTAKTNIGKRQNDGTCTLK